MSSILSNLLNAVKHADNDQLKQLVKAGNVNFRDPKEGLSLLAWAVSLNYASTVRILLDHGASINVCDPHGYCAIHRAAWLSSVEVAEMLLQAGASANAPNPRLNRTPLVLAAIRGDVDMVDLLCRSGADVDARDGDGLSAVDHASSAGRSDVVKFLMNNGAECNNARVHCELGDEDATTVPQRDAYNEIASMLCAVWADQSAVTVL